MNAPATTVDRPEPSSRPTTSSPKSRLLGFGVLGGLAILLAYALFFTEPDATQRDAVRLLYVHVPVAILTYATLITSAIASVVYLRNRSLWADTTAHATAEVGTLLCALTLVTGSIWGRPVWNTWWEWGDVRLMTSLILFLLFVGYLALRRVPADPAVQRRRAAIVAIVAVVDIPIVYKSVDWWPNRTIHQQSTFEELKFEGLTFFTLMLGMVVFGLLVLWLVLHRFRVGWLEHQLDEHGLEAALAERRAEATVGVDAAVGEAGARSFDAVEGERP